MHGPAHHASALARPPFAGSAARGRAAVGLVSLALASGCGAAATPAAADGLTASPRAAPDIGNAAPGSARRTASAAKAALFRDAGLVPTPAGERARQELAWADSIRQALARDPQLLAPWVEVRANEPPTPDTARGWWEPAAAVTPAHVLVVAGVAATDAGSEQTLDELRASIARVVSATVGPIAPAGLTIELHPAPAAPPRPRSATPLLFAVLGFGLSAGVVLERIRSRRRGAAARVALR